MKTKIKEQWEGPQIRAQRIQLNGWRLLLHPGASDFSLPLCVTGLIRKRTVGARSSSTEETQMSAKRCGPESSVAACTPVALVFLSLPYNLHSQERGCAGAIYSRVKESRWIYTK